MLNFWFQKQKGPSHPGLVAIGLAPDGFTFVHAINDAGEKPRVMVCEHRPVEDPNPINLREAIASAVKDHGLEGAYCSVLMRPDQFSLRMVDAPQVPDEELKSATIWLIKDLIDFKIEEAVSDAFLVPNKEQGSPPAKAYVAVARQNAVMEIISLIDGTGLTLHAIDIPEMGLRNLVTILPENTRGTALLQLRPKGGMLTVSQEGHLYLTRPVATNLEQLQDACSEQSNEEGHNLYTDGERTLDGLLLEVQRSLDYYESGFGPSPPSNLLLAPTAIEVPPLETYLSQNLAVNVRSLDLNEALECEKPIPLPLQARALSVLGAALRSDEVPQQVDLYDERFKAPDLVLPAVDVFKMCGLFLAVLLLFTTVRGCSISSLKGDVAELQASQKALEAENAAYEQEFPPAVADTVLDAQVQGLEREQTWKKRLVAELTNQDPANSIKFSSYLEGLASQPVKGLWLREIHVRKGGLDLAGSTVRPELVPRFMKQLGREKAFEGREFKTFKMDSKTEGSGHIDFELKTEAAGGTPKGGTSKGGKSR